MAVTSTQTALETLSRDSGEARSLLYSYGRAYHPCTVSAEEALHSAE
jgi:hypothetical protein